MTSPLNIVFAGTPVLAARHLQALLEANYHIAAVFTQPDRPAGRGRKLLPSPVKQLAIEQQIPVYQPISLRNLKMQQELAMLKPDLMVVVAYGLILPQAVLDIPRYGCINVHASLLPRWRGASPINQAILAGDNETGITIMQMDAGLDTGNMLNVVKCPISSTDTAESLHDRLAEIGPPILIKTLQELEAKQLNPVVQSHERATYAPKINKTDALLQWHKSAIELSRQIRAYNSWPVCYTYFQQQMVKVWQVQVITGKAHAVPGTVVQITKQGINVATGEGVLQLQVLQLPGGKPLAISDLLNGKKLPLKVGDQLISTQEKPINSAATA